MPNGIVLEETISMDEAHDLLPDPALYDMDKAAGSGVNLEQVNNVSVNNAQRNRSHFNLDHDVNTTASLGTIQPLGFMDMFPHDKLSFKPSTLVRAGAMVVPAWAKFKWQLSSAFVPIKSVFPNYDYFLTGTYKRSSQGKLSIGTLPWITTAQLTALCCAGAKMSIWFNGYPTDHDKYWVKATRDSNESIKNIISAVHQPANLGVVTDGGNYGLLPNYRGMVFNATFLWQNNLGWENRSGSRPLWLPLGNPVTGSFDSETRFDDVFYNNEDITPDNADFVIETTPLTGGVYARNFALCFKLSDKGKLFAKMLRGLGYSLDFRADTADDRVSLLPLLAWYRAYFKFNGIERLRNWESTYCHQLIHLLEEFGDSRCSFDVSSTHWYAPISGTSSTFAMFVMDELYDSFYPTENYNFISAHRADIANKGSTSSYDVGVYNNERFYDYVDMVNNAINSISSEIKDTGVNSSADGINTSVDNGLSLVNTVFTEATAAGIKAVCNGNNGITATEIEALKRLQRMTSKHDVLGQNVRSLLKAFGVDDYNDEEPVEILGFRSFDLNISEVTSLADTFNNDVGDGGRYLGEQAGKSVTMGSDEYSKPIVCSTDERGFFIVMGGVMPVSGYVNMADHRNYMVTRPQQYDKELEGLGYDASRIERLFGDLRVSFKDSTIKKHNFGFVPHWSSIKVKSNINNGDFNRPSKINALLPYTSDRVIRVLQPNGTTYVAPTAQFGKSFISTMSHDNTLPTKLPIAGKEWTYAYKYGFMGQLNRMFVNYDKQLDGLPGGLYYPDGRAVSEWSYEQEDNFVVHNRIIMSLESEMLPIADTYMTQDDSAKANETVSLS
ncbi:unnamed protein product [Cylicocyclus nassatus]|uniref:Major capsid protein n=1 Tax=Cylicocyclus nassatus TaxID=53992 RepID=A0AA36DTI5_CYLNA|nr:unnamed protein product [Cylicocyclus nassatus]CAJ0592410.1 unnamed protein product [Cylicocyclus nassatus]CAJ0592411.1 unnamed protein product [Cylicocyclus nassatus]